MAIRLKPAVILSLKGQTAVLVELAEEYGLNNIESIRRWMRKNKSNGPLTTKAALKIISRRLMIPEADLTEETKHETDSKGINDLEPAGARPFS